MAAGEQGVASPAHSPRDDNERCTQCDRPKATQADYDATKEGEGEHLCWVDFGSSCDPVNWRARALAAEAALNTRAASPAEECKHGEPPDCCSQCGALRMVNEHLTRCPEVERERDGWKASAKDWETDYGIVVKQRDRDRAERDAALAEVEKLKFRVRRCDEEFEEVKQAHAAIRDENEKLKEQWREWEWKASEHAGSIATAIVDTELTKLRKALGGYKDSDLASLAETLRVRNEALERENEKLRADLFSARQALDTVSQALEKEVPRAENAEAKLAKAREAIRQAHDVLPVDSLGRVTEARSILRAELAPVCKCKGYHHPDNCTMYGTRECLGCTDCAALASLREGSAPSPATTEQPAPVGSGTPVWPLVIEDMQARAELGLRRYGTPLRTNNGRDALVDAYQEALDQVVYLRQAIEERNDLREGSGS